LIVMHDQRGKPQELLTRWSDQAARHGYLLAAPELGRGLQGYGYTSEEHRAVLDVLADLKRHFQVDSDRVFLSGCGDGADMAYDVGLSHPDLFAGVVPVSGAPHKYAVDYRNNGQYLPFLAVCGDMAGPAQSAALRQFRTWITRSFPMTYVLYKGRGAEWFA